MLFVIAFARAFVFEVYKIPSGAMLPTLQVGDHVLVNTAAYGIRLPWTETKFFSAQPQTGSVVIFVPPGEPDQRHIARLIALGGETVAIREDILYRNGKAVPRIPLASACAYDDGNRARLTGDITETAVFQQKCSGYKETINGQAFVIYQNAADNGEARVPVNFPSEYLPCPPKTGSVKTGRMPACKIDPGHAFFMGDTRDNSRDSRYFGGVPISGIEGKAALVWLSYGAKKGVRWRRFFHSIHTDSP